MTYNLVLCERLTRGDPPPIVDNITEIARNWRRSIRAVGGYWLGSFDLSGDDLAKEELEWWYDYYLGYHLKESTFGLSSWEGLIYEVDLRLDGVQYRRTLDREWFHNRVKVVYRDGGANAETAWSEDTDSSGKYGTLEYIDIVGERTASGATATRDRRLVYFGIPGSRMVGGLEFPKRDRERMNDSLTVKAAGYVATLNWLYRETSIASTAASTAITTLVGDAEFVVAGDIESNTLSVDVDCETPQRLWDAIEDVILQGDASGNLWVGGVYADRQFDYGLAEVDAITYYVREGQLVDRPGIPVVPELVVPNKVVRNASAPSAGSGSVLSDPDNAWIEEVEFIAPDRVRLKPTGFVDVEVLKEPL